MDSHHRRSRALKTPLLGPFSLIVSLLAAGCASPGPPRAPSLSLPQPVRDLTVTRTGNTVQLQFSAPSRSTDKLPLRAGTISGQFCRQLDAAPCLPVPASRQAVIISDVTGKSSLVTWNDPLPPDLTKGPPRLLVYRVELFSPAGRSAGSSNTAFTTAGLAPSPAENLHAQGSRIGVILSWNPTSRQGDVLLKRENLAPEPRKPDSPDKSSTKTAPAVIWLEATANDSSSPSPRTLDTSVLPNIPFRYTAQRRETIQLGAHSIKVLSDPSAPITFTLHDIYPPPSPTGLTAIGYFSNSPQSDAPQTFAVDLVWQPVDGAGLTAGLAGYNVYREVIDPTLDPRDLLNSAPIATPAFHDTSADPAARYRYYVTAVDTKGNESPAATVILEPSTKH